MNHTRNDIEQLLDDATAGIRGEQPDDASVETVATRVWAQLSAVASTASELNFASVREPAAEVRTCADFQSLIPHFLRGELAPARRLLLEDHTHECVPCRRALKDARAEATGALSTSNNFVTTQARKANRAAKINRAPISPSRSPSFAQSFAQWRVAAALAVACALIALVVWQPFAKVDALNMTVAAADGALYRVAESDSQMLASGDKFRSGESVMTAKDANAVLRLDDGSLVEMRERSQVSISKNRDGATINLERGQIIVEAAPQNSGHLYVRTPDALVSVKGTIFSVNSGTKGARIAVVEGTVEVNAAGKETVLHAGDQTTTRSTLAQTSIANEIAWSKNSDKYRQLLAEAARVGGEIDAQSKLPGRRYSTRLLDLTAQETVFYVALPNWGASLADSFALFQNRLRENPALDEWWQSRKRGNPNHEAQMNFVVEHLRGWGAQLGDEIVVASALGAHGEPSAPLVLAEVRDEAQFKDFLTGEIEILRAQMGKDANKDLAINFASSLTDAPQGVTDTAHRKIKSKASEATSAPKNEIFLYVHDGIFAASPDVNTLRAVFASSDNSQNLVRDAFHARLAAAYRDGTNFVLAADLRQILARHKNALPQNEREDGRNIFHQTGFDDLQFLIVESKDASVDGNDADKQIENILTVSFNGARRGMAAWLAAPHAMGALGFISPEANLAAAFVVKEPTALVDDIFAVLRSADPNAIAQIEAAQNASGINLRNDFAATLGGEFAFAIDGPVLPVPSWKLIAEVYEPATLQTTLERLVTKANELARLTNKPQLELTSSELGGHTYYTLKSANMPIEINYTFAHGYLLAAPSRALLDRALSTRDSGFGLRQAARFKAAMPTNGEANFSALFYQNLPDMLDKFAPLADKFAAQANPGDDRKLRVASIASHIPALAYAQAYDDRIVISAPSKGAPFGITPGAILGLPGGSFDMRDVIEEGAINR